MAALLFLVGCASSRPPPQVEQITSAELEQRLAKATRKAPGVVFGAVRRDGTTVLRAAGKADLHSGRNATTDTPFAWFSLTKLFTATAILQLSEQGRINLDAPVSTYLPDIHLRREGHEATVRQLLSHTSGLPNPLPVSWIHLATETCPALDEMIRQRVGSEPKLASVPGTRSAYSNLGYLLLGSIVEQVSGISYGLYVEQNVLVPLGCHGSGFAVPSDRATAYQRKWCAMGLGARGLLDGRFFGETIGGYWALCPFTLDGAPYGGLSGPADSLLRFALMTLREGEGEQGRVLTPASVRLMIQPALTSDGQPTSVGLGWQLRRINGERYLMHDGGGGGYRAELRIYPDRGYAVAVLANESSFATEELARAIIR